MPRGLVLISTSADWERVEKVLRSAQASRSFVAETHSIIETWCPCLGNADYAVRVFGLSVESIRRASAAIRSLLILELDDVRSQVATDSIIGSSLLDMTGPSGAALLVSEIRNEMALNQREKGSLASEEEQATAINSVEIATVVRAAVLDAITQLQDLVDCLAQPAEPGEYNPLLSDRLAPISNELKGVLRETRQRLLTKKDEQWTVADRVRETASGLHDVFQREAEKKQSDSK